MNKKPYLIRRYLRDRRTGWPLVREYIVHSVKVPKVSTENSVSASVVGFCMYDLTDKTVREYWKSPYSKESLERAGIKCE